MRYSLTTAVVLAGVFLGLHAFGPNEPGLDGPNIANAQFGGGFGGGGPQGGLLTVTNSDESANLGIRLFSMPRPKTFPEKISIPASSDYDYPAGLKKTIEVDFDHTPLKEALASIAEATAVRILSTTGRSKTRGLNRQTSKLPNPAKWSAGSC